MSSSRSHSRLRTVLVTGEIALSLFLLVGAGLLIRGIYLIENQKLGFQPSHLLTAGISLDSAHYKDGRQQVRFVQDLLLRLRQLPGVNAVAATSDLPATGPGKVPLQIQGQPELPDKKNLTAVAVTVTEDFFRTAEVPLLQGRAFADSDNSGAPKAVLVNQEFVHRYLRDQEPLGKQIRLNVDAAVPEWKKIVGVVGNVKTFSEQTNDDPAVYEPFQQHPLASFSVMLRTSSDPNTVSSVLRSAVAQVDPELPLSQMMSMTTVIDHQKGGDAFFSQILSSFALLALGLAAVGIYGLIAYSVTRRTHEIGIRMAMGAKSSDVLRMVLWQGSKMTVIGAAIGLAMAMPLPMVFDSVFYGIRVQEPRIYLVVPIVILVIATIAAYIPARRAANVDPMVALRYE